MTNYNPHIDETGVTCPEEGCDYTSSKQGVKIHYGRSHEGSISGVMVECAHCGTKQRKDEYRLDRSENLFCSKDCHYAWAEENIEGELAGGWEGGVGTKEFTCANCGSVKSAKRRRVEQYEKNFCNERCMGEYYASGYVPSGKDHKWYGRDMSGENNPLHGVTGEQHPAWKGGHDGSWRRADDNRWRNLARKIYRRDGYVCHMCYENGMLHAHHIQPVSEGGPKYEPDNIITLCEACHNYVHSSSYSGRFLKGGD